MPYSSASSCSVALSSVIQRRFRILRLRSSSFSSAMLKRSLESSSTPRARPRWPGPHCSPASTSPENSSPLRRSPAWGQRTCRAREPLLHFAHVAHFDSEVPGDGPRLFLREPRQILLHPAQVEEELALGLGRRDLHQPPVPQHVLVNFRAYPMHRERDEAHTDGRVESLHGLHQAHIASCTRSPIGNP